jgi:hypothetical protein
MSKAKITKIDGIKFKLTPATDTKMAAIHLEIDPALFEEYAELIRGTSKSEDVKLRVINRQKINPDARKRLKGGNILNSTT